MTKKRILLVDDQKLILLGLERMLRRMRGEWEIVPAESGQGALELMAAQPFDAVVADLNMPGFSGVELLDRVREQWPATARIVLSGHQDKSMILGATRSTHRFLTKPCEPDQLLATLRHILEIRDREDVEPGIRNAVGSAGQLASSPVTLHKLRMWLDDPSAPVRELGALVRQDPGLSAMVLHLVHSSFFGSPRPTMDPAEAVEALDREKAACLLAPPADAQLEARLKPIREAHLRAARQASAIARREGGSSSERDLAYAAALLGAAGPMILAAGSFPEPAATAAFRASRLYLGLMGLPAPIPALAGGCAEPSLADPGVPALPLAAAHVALGFRDEAFLSRTGFLPRVEAWLGTMDTDGEC